LVPGSLLACWLLAACGAAPETTAVDAAAAKADTRAAELAVKVANGTASAAEKAELDLFIRGRK
jgi:hypothetical protein